MVYTKTVTTPANTTEANKVRTQLKVVRGLIYRFELYIPPGASGLVHTYLMDSSTPLYPSTPGETFFGDGITISFEDLYEVNSEIRLLDIWAYNLDDTYDHMIQVRLGMVSKDEYIARFLPSYARNEAQAILDMQFGRDNVRQGFSIYFFLSDLIPAGTGRIRQTAHPEGVSWTYCVL